MVLAEAISLLDKSQGRDKIIKTFIYTLKLIDNIRTIRTKIPSYGLERIAARFQHARRLFRLGKFMSEFDSIRKHLNDTTKDEFNRMMIILCKFMFGVYWILDNLQVLGEYGFIRVPSYLVEYYSMTAKFLALVFALLLNFRNMVRMHYEEIKTRKKFAYLRKQENLTASEKVGKLVSQQRISVLLFIKIVGDMLPSVSRSIFARRLLKIRIPGIVQSIGGLSNALISCYLSITN